MRLTACRGKEWTGEYITDFSKILPGIATMSLQVCCGMREQLVVVSAEVHPPW